jgi:cytochrome P450
MSIRGPDDGRRPLGSPTPGANAPELKAAPPAAPPAPAPDDTRRSESGNATWGPVHRAQVTTDREEKNVPHHPSATSKCPFHRLLARKAPRATEATADEKFAAAFKAPDVLDGIEKLLPAEGSVRYQLPNGSSTWFIGEVGLLRELGQMTSRPESDGTVLVERPDFSKRAALGSLIRPASIFQVESPRHSVQAKSLRMALMPKALESSGAGASVEAILDRRFAALVPSQAPRATAAVNISEELNALAFEVLLKTLFGVQLAPDEVRAITASFGTQMRAVGEELRFIAGGKPAGSSPEAAAAIDQFARSVLASLARKAPDALTPFAKALLALTNEGGTKPSVEELVDQVVFFLAAGHETTATAMTTTLLHIVSDPTRLARVTAEARAALPGPATASSLPALEAAIASALTAAPAAPLLARRVQVDFELAAPASEPGPSLSFKAGDRILMLPRAAAAHEAKASHDGADGEAAAANLHLAFGLGSRVCMGRNLALLEIRTTLSRLFRDFDVQLPEASRGAPIPYTTDFSHHPAAPLTVVLTRAGPAADRVPPPASA